MVAGRENHTFYIHRLQLLKNSEFFERALGRNLWAEAQKHVVELPEIKPRAMKVYAAWVYTHDTDDKLLWNWPGDEEI